MFRIPMGSFRFISRLVKDTRRLSNCSCQWIEKGGTFRTNIMNGRHSSMLLVTVVFLAYRFCSKQEHVSTELTSSATKQYITPHGTAIARASTCLPQERRTVFYNRIPILPRTASDVQIDDPDSIPTLSLPPPIMPHRVYGHNYLDKNYLVVVTIGSPPDLDARGSEKAIRFHPRLSDSILARSISLPSPNRLKMVITAGPGVNAAPYTIALPQQNSCDTFMFQASSLKDLTLEFSIYPNFGTKTIGRAVAHPSIFHTPDGSFTTLSILDHRLHSIGEVCNPIGDPIVQKDERSRVSHSGYFFGTCHHTIPGYHPGGRRIRRNLLEVPDATAGCPFAP